MLEKSHQTSWLPRSKRFAYISLLFGCILIKSVFVAWTHVQLVRGGARLISTVVALPEFSNSNNETVMTHHYNASKIAIHTVADQAYLEKYKPNLDTMRCYAKLHGYQFIASSPTPECQQLSSHIMLQRVCTQLQLMKQQSSIEWFLFLDGDIAVVNMNHKLEDKYIVPYADKDLIFGLRFHNNEVMAGLYFVKNSEYGRAFLQEWLDSRPGMPNHGGGVDDNSILHWVLLHRLAGPSIAGWSDCRSNGLPRVRRREPYYQYEHFVPCFHRVLHNTDCEGFDWSHIAILPHATHVAYDGWVTHYKWTNETFMHHAMKIPVLKANLGPPTNRFVQGRIMPPMERCDAETQLYRKGEYYTTQEEVDAEFAEAKLRERNKHFPTTWNVSSCVQNRQQQQQQQQQQQSTNTGAADNII